jgi:T3SS (YopN, CesT) and YbjN peptide-binding chaperone 1/T3SS (YopN, CesT) and YbjN peptide-binding chaperone 3
METKGLLAPVPHFQLAKALEVFRREGRIAFASSVWELSGDLEAGMPVLFYASRTIGAAGAIPEPERQWRHPYVTWLGSFVRYVSAVGGCHPETTSVSTVMAQGDESHILGFYEVADLEQLPEQRWIPIEQLRDRDGRPCPQAFIPARPIIVLWDRSTEGAAATPLASTAEPSESTELSWSGVTKQLAAGISKMQRDHSLILSVSSLPDETERPWYYVQFACGGEEGFRAEAVSNRFLADRWKLSEKAAETLFRLGWHAPEPDTESQAGNVNYWTDWPAPPQAPAIAQLAISTFRRVYGVTSSDRLEYRYFDKAGQELELADLGLRRKGADKVEDGTIELLRPIVERALHEALQAGELKYDEHGDIRIRFGSAMVIVRLVGGETPKVQVFSPLLWEVSTTTGLVEVLNDINTRISYGRVFWDGEQVMAAIELPAAGLSGEYVAQACFEIGSLSDHFDEELVERFGGKTMFGLSKVSKPYEPPGYL